MNERSRNAGGNRSAPERVPMRGDVLRTEIERMLGGRLADFAPLVNAIFTTPPGSLAAPTIPEHYVRGVELNASQAAQDAVILFLLAGYLPLSAVTLFSLTLLAAADAAAAQAILGIGGGGGAPTTAQYLVGSADGTLSAERVVTDTATIAWDLATAGQAKAKLADMAAGGYLGRVAAGAVSQVVATTPERVEPGGADVFHYFQASSDGEIKRCTLEDLAAALAPLLGL